MPSDRPDAARDLSRRTFLKSATVTAGLGAGLGALAAPGQDPAPAGAVTSFPPGSHEIRLKVNGREYELEVEPRTTLLDALRDQLDLTGTKKVCDRGSCGACTVLLDGAPVNSCMILAMDAVGSETATIEGLATDGRLHPLQEAFIECDALQCGYCTPGMVMAGIACLAAHEQPGADEIRHELAGNVCRCGTYGRVFEAVEKVARGHVKSGRVVR